MYIIIVGGGKVGYHLAKALLNEGHEILIIEMNARRAESIAEELGSVCVQGDGCETSTLAEVGTNRADMFITVTGDDEDNLVACQVAKHKFGVPRTIALINNPQNERIFKELGIDDTVSSTNVILEHIEQEVPTHPLTHLMSIKDRGLEVIEVKIPPQSSTVGKKIRELFLPEDSILPLLIRKKAKPRIPTPNTILQEDDQLIAVTRPEFEDALRKAITGA